MLPDDAAPRLTDSDGSEEIRIAVCRCRDGGIGVVADPMVWRHVFTNEFAGVDCPHCRAIVEALYLVMPDDTKP